MHLLSPWIIHGFNWSKSKNKSSFFFPLYPFSYMFTKFSKSFPCILHMNIVKVWWHEFYLIWFKKFTLQYMWCIYIYIYIYVWWCIFFLGFLTIMFLLQSLATLISCINFLFSGFSSSSIYHFFLSKGFHVNLYILILFFLIIYSSYYVTNMQQFLNLRTIRTHVLAKAITWLRRSNTKHILSIENWRRVLHSLHFQ